MNQESLIHRVDCWKGRVDTDEGTRALRLHQRVRCEPHEGSYQRAPVFLGMASDEGVRRNQGRAGAVKGPMALRAALSNLCVSAQSHAFDLGDIVCEDGDLDRTQRLVSERLAETLRRDGFPVVLGGGHEIAYASFLGAQKFLQARHPGARLGIVNFDSHFDLRNPDHGATSGTPFRQAHQWCDTHNVPFHYVVVGLNPAANTTALFQFAYDHQVSWINDLDCLESRMAELSGTLARSIDSCDALYLSCCLDVFPAAQAPGVSAPAGLGVPPAVVMELVAALFREAKRRQIPILVADIAELNPDLDQDSRTARLAARYLYQVLCHHAPDRFPAWRSPI